MAEAEMFAAGGRSYREVCSSDIGIGRDDARGRILRPMMRFCECVVGGVAVVEPAFYVGALNKKGSRLGPLFF